MIFADKIEKMYLTGEIYILAFAVFGITRGDREWCGCRICGSVLRL